MSKEHRPAHAGSGSNKLLVVLVLAALAVAIFLGVKYFQRRQALEETAVAPPAAATQPGNAAGQGADLPLFAPRAGQDAAPAPEASQTADENEGAPSVTMRAAAPATDRVLTTDFVHDLAAFLASAYQPAHSEDNAGNRGLTTMTFKRLNMRYGVDLTGLDVDRRNAAKGRREALEHLMSPIVLRLAFDIFSQPFADELAAEGARQTRSFKSGDGYAEHALSAGQVREMLRLYASLSADVGNTFQAFASRPDLVQAASRYFQAAGAVNAAYGKYADREAAGAPQAELDAISVEVRDAIQARERMRAALLKDAAPRPGSLLAEADVLDIAAWTYRRLSRDPEAINAVGAMASLSGELAQKLNAYVYPQPQ